MATFPEARAKHAERVRRRGRRHYAAAMLGPTCPGCRTKIPTAARCGWHPCCGPDAVALLERDRRTAA